MKLITVVPDSKEHWLSMRENNLNSTEISALFGLNPYTTEFELWHRKKNNITVEFSTNERTLWGNRLEQAIAKASADEKGWIIRHAPEYVSAPELRLGSSYDYIIQEIKHDDIGMFKSVPILDVEILEIKNVDSMVFKDGWLVDEDGGIEAPPHIELQIQQQMLLKPMIQRTRIRALVGGNRMVEIVRERNPEICEMIINKSRKFWKSIDDNIPPSPDFSHDEDTLRKLYGYAEPGKVLVADEYGRITDLADLYCQASAMAKSYEEQKKAYKNELMTLIGDAEKVVGRGFSITAGVTAPTEIAAHTRAGFRQFRIYQKKTVGQ